MKAVLTALFIWATLATSVTKADVVEIGVSQQGSEFANLERPGHGMTKSQVESKFGPPQEILDPVGNPPISTWVYEHYSVYFEYDTVLHTVLNQH